jgi:hypothetical protein
MKRALLAAALLVGLAGCMSREERLAQIEAADDRTCLSYGAQKGTDGYVSCRAQLNASRANTAAVRGTAPPGCSQFLNIINCY